jgi:hypothetical protein
VLIVHGTRKLLDPAGGPSAAPDEASTTRLGSWYATVLFWKPQVALLVNETTLLPALMPLPPGATVLARVPAALERILAVHGVDSTFIDAEIAEMAEGRLAKTNSRSVVGVMNEFTHLADASTDGGRAGDLDALSLWLAQTPCGPLYKTHVSPDRALAAAITATAEDPSP